MTLVNKNLEPWGIYIGIPAKRLKERKKGLLKLETELASDLSTDSNDSDLNNLRF